LSDIRGIRSYNLKLYKVVKKIYEFRQPANTN